MAELKKFQTKHPIYVDLSIRLVKNGFNFMRVNDLGEVAGTCSECGHPIRYEFWYSENETGEEFSFGSECNYKIYVLLHWQDQIEYKDVEDKQLQRAGKWLWILYRDKLITQMKEEEIIPQPKDYIGVDEEGNKTKDYKLLADDMKRLVLRIRSRIKKEIVVKEKKLKAIKQREEEKKGAKEFIERHGINLAVCSDKEKTFLATVYRCEQNLWTLSEKQQKWFDDIIKRSKNGVDEKESVSKITATVIELHNKANLSNVNEWELDFIDSVLDQVNDGRNLSPKQLNIIEKLEIRILGVSQGSQGNSVKLVQHIKEFKTQTIREEPKQEVKEVINLDGIDYDLTNKYQEKKTKTWVIHEKFSLWTQAVIITVKKETDKAILCNLELENIENGIRNDVWIPLSQLEEIITL